MADLTQSQVDVLADELESTCEALEVRVYEALRELAKVYGFNLVPYIDDQEDGGW